MATLNPPTNIRIVKPRTCSNCRYMVTRYHSSTDSGYAACQRDIVNGGDGEAFMIGDDDTMDMYHVTCDGFRYGNA